MIQVWVMVIVILKMDDVDQGDDSLSHAQPVQLRHPSLPFLLVFSVDRLCMLHELRGNDLTTVGDKQDIDSQRL